MYELKFNANCPDSEKSGSGPGSCGGEKNKNISGITLPNNMKLVEKNTKYGTEYELYNPEGKLSLSTYDKNTLKKTINKLEKYYNKNSDTIKNKENTNTTVIISKEINKERNNNKSNISNNTMQNETDSKVHDNTKNLSIDPTKLSWNEAEPYYKEFLTSLSTKNLPGKGIKIYKVKNTDVKVKGNFDKAELGRMLYQIHSLPSSMFVNKPNIFFVKKQVAMRDFSDATGIKTEMGGGFSGNGITFYTDVSNKTITHELAHSVDISNIYSNSKEYEDVIKKDRLIPDSDRFTSKYAQDSYAIYNTRKGEKYNRFVEDFADGIGKFFLDRENFEKKFPNRFEYYKKILKL